MNRTLEEIIDDYESTRMSYREFTKRGELNKQTLIEFESRFTDLRADLRPIRSKIAREYEKRSDKQATAIKFRIAVAIHEGSFLDDTGKPVYEECSINQAEKYASSSKPYKEFLEQKCFYKESYVNITDLREDMSMFINEIKDRIKAEQ